MLDIGLSYTYIGGNSFDPLKHLLHRVFTLFKPRNKKKTFPHLGSTVLVAPPKDPMIYLYHPIEKVVQVVWVLSRRSNNYQNIKFITNHNNTFYLDDVKEGRVEVLWRRKHIEIGFDTFYKNKWGETIREQLIHPNGDFVFEGVAA